MKMVLFNHNVIWRDIWDLISTYLEQENPWCSFLKTNLLISVNMNKKIIVFLFQFQRRSSMFKKIRSCMSVISYLEKYERWHFSVQISNSMFKYINFNVRNICFFNTHFYEKTVLFMKIDCWFFDITGYFDDSQDQDSKTKENDLLSIVQIGCRSKSDLKKTRLLLLNKKNYD